MDLGTITRMDQGTAEEYALSGKLMNEHIDSELVDNLLRTLKLMEGPSFGYAVDRFQHSLQSGTLAYRDGEDEETVVCALLHDIGDVLAPQNHSQMAAAVLRPYISEKNYWVIQHHGLFQGYYYYDKIGLDKNAREHYRDHPYFDACERFCERWDQVAFDPKMDTLPLEFFEPMVRRVIKRVENPFD